jgi:GntR family transcriptional repressor for pyruvate dehydrogenase complex
MSDDKRLFHPIKGKRVFEEVSQKIKELVINGVFEPGDRLPSEMEIAKQFNVGRQSVREALRLLEHSGLITIQQGGNGGPLIKDTMIDKIRELLVDAIRVRKITLEELTSARVDIEKLVLTKIHDRIGDIDLRVLQENVAAARKKLNNGEIATEENIAFHVLLAEASKNPVFLLVVETLMAMDSYFIEQGGSTLEGSKRITGIHDAILRAIKSNKWEKASILIEEDIREVEKILLKAKIY